MPGVADELGIRAVTVPEPEQTNLFDYEPPTPTEEPATEPEPVREIVPEPEEEETEPVVEEPTEEGETESLEDADQATLFGDLEQFAVWRQEWRAMPEFVQEDQEPWKTLIVHFSSRGDMDAFAALVEQRLTKQTQSIWYPEAEILRLANKRYVDEETKE